MRQDDPDAVNPYASPSAPPDFVADRAEVPRVAALRAFVGPRADYYLAKWSPALQETSRSVGMNWAAFFLSGFWFPYRKMYKLTVILYAFIVVEAIGEHVLFITLGGQATIPEWPNRLVTLLFAAVCGKYANRWYLSHAEEKISRLRATGFENEGLWRALARRGGTSLGASLGMFALLLVVVTLLVLVLEGL